MKTVTDPYVVLGIAYDASDEQIKQAFHEAMHVSQDTSEITQAYYLIRTQEARAEYQWKYLNSLLCAPTFSNKLDLDLEALIREVAFQSEWELGEDRCPTK